MILNETRPIKEVSLKEIQKALTIVGQQLIAAKGRFTVSETSYLFLKAGVATSAVITAIVAVDRLIDEGYDKIKV